MISKRDGHYQYRGYQYITWDENDGDWSQTFHECWKDGQQVRMSREFYNQSPYDLIEYDDFVKFVNTLEVFIQG